MAFNETLADKAGQWFPSTCDKISQAPVPNPTKSFWLHSDPNANPLARHGADDDLPTSSDVVVIGSGISGIFTVFHLIDKLARDDGPLRIVVLEARDFCSGATGTSSSFIRLYVACD